MSRPRSNFTRVLHIALLLIVLHQLIGSAFVERPMPGDDPDWPFLMHVWTGVAGAQILAAFWLWTLARGRHETPLPRLIPWLFPSRLRALFVELSSVVRDLAALRAPSLDLPAISSAVHGLGLLLMTLVVSTGSLWYFVLDGTRAGHWALLAHKATGDLMWAFVIGHATMAALHHFLGEDTLKMFWIRRRTPRNAAGAPAR